MTLKPAVSLLSLTLCLSISQTMTAFANGGVVGGGGHSVYCQQDAQAGFPKAGYYALDYALNVDPATENVNEVFGNADVFTHLARIQKGLTSIPELDARFDLFVKNLNNKAEWNKKNRYVWNNYPAGIPATLDHDKEKLVPEACKEQGQLILNQVTVRRGMSDDVVKFEIKQERLNELEQTSGLQLSYHYVHEFLRDFTNKAQVLATVNHFFHSVNFENISEKTLLNNLRLNSMGLGDFKGLSQIKQEQDLEKTFFSKLTKNKRIMSVVDNFISLAPNKDITPRYVSENKIYKCTISMADGTQRLSTEKLTAFSDGTYVIDSFSRLSNLKPNSTHTFWTNSVCLETFCSPSDRKTSMLPFAERSQTLFVRFNNDKMAFILHSQSYIENMPKQNYNYIELAGSCKALSSN